MPARRGVAPPDRARGYGWLMGLRRYMGSGGRACVEPQYQARFACFRLPVELGGARN